MDGSLGVGAEAGPSAGKGAGVILVVGDAGGRRERLGILSPAVPEGGDG